MTSPDPVTEAELIADADRSAQRWLTDIGARPVFPDRAAIDAVRALDARLTDIGRPATEAIELLDEVAGLATVASNDPRYFGFVIGATLPWPRQPTAPPSTGISAPPRSTTHPPHTCSKGTVVALDPTLRHGLARLDVAELPPSAVTGPAVLVPTHGHASDAPCPENRTDDSFGKPPG
jgi:hypothetical protein